MARHRRNRHREEVEINFVALMDTMTNVVGVLLIVLVMVGISIANTVKRVMSELPPVTLEEYTRMKRQVEADAPTKSPEQLQKELAELEAQRNKHTEELKNLDTTMDSQRVVISKMEELKKQLADRGKERDAKKAATETLLASMEKAKALLDTTPVPETPAATLVKLPNPRPYPKKPVETRVLISREGALFYNEKAYLDPVYDALKRGGTALRYNKDVNAAVFAELMQKIMGDGEGAREAWPVVAEFVGKFQVEDVARTFKVLTDAQVKVDRKEVERVADLADALGKPMPAVAQAIAEAVKGNFTPWTKLNPNPAKPVLAAADDGTKVKMTWYDKVKEVRKNPREVMGLFQRPRRTERSAGPDEGAGGV